MQPYSVLIAVYHKERPEWFRQALASVFRQTARPDEVVLMEDGPLPEPLEAVVREYEAAEPTLRVVRCPENRGLGIVLNDGLNHCTHDLVARMDSDDVSKPDRFEKQLRAFDEHPEVDLVTAWLEEFTDNPAHPVSVKRLPEHHEELYRYGWTRNPVNHATTMFRRSAVLRAGGYQHFHLMEDYYLWVRMLMQGSRFYCIPEALYSCRIPVDFFARRGGWNYALTEFHLICFMYGVGYITWRRALLNIFLRMPARIFPPRLLSWIYRKFLRKGRG